MELIDAVRSRRSANRLTDPAPTDDELLDLVTDAATGPDHGLLRPWRLITIRGEARHTLGTALAAGAGDDQAARDKAAGKPLRAPLLVAIVLQPRDNPKVPEWEQLAATAAMVHNLGLLLHGRGFGAIWRTGEPTRSPQVRDLLGLGTGEQLLGWLYVGTADAQRPPAPRPRFEPQERLFTLHPGGDITPLFPATTGVNGR